jgi:endonuclease III
VLAKVIKKIKKSKKSLLKRVKTSKGFFTNKYRFKLRWTPFEEYPQVDKQTYQEVFDLLAASLSRHGISLDRKSKDAEVVGAPQGPMHAGDAVTVDALVKVIMSQATNNENALSAQARLIKTFPYTVDEETVVGKIPNYHDIRTADPAKLKNALVTAGLQNMRAKTIPECLNAIRQKNIDADSPGCTLDCNPPNAADFVPGSLSLEYLNKRSTQEKLDELVSLPGIGIKTACCILAFNFQLPVFAVDTHVFRMVKWLGWVPVGCNRDDASAHLDAFVPDELKYGLHQGFWHHGQKCLRCMAKNDPTTKGWEDAECVLEEYLKRHPKKERKSPSQKRKKADDNDNDGDDDGGDTPKPSKGNKTMTTKPMTAEQAEEDGYELHEIEINDNFNAPALGNVTHVKKVWVKKHLTKDG